MNAIDQLHAAVRDRPQDWAAWCRLSAALAKQGNLPAAREGARRAQSLNPPETKDWLALGKLWELAEDPNAAIAAYQRATRLDQRNLEARLSLGRLMLEMGDARAAVLAFRVATSIAPDHQPAHLALAYALSGTPREALVHAELAARLAPETSEPFALLAELYEKEGEATKAMHALEQVLELDPENFDAAVGLARKLLAEGEEESGRSMLKRALEIGPRTAGHYAALGHALMEAGKLDHAIRFFKERARLDPSSSDAHLTLGIALEHAGTYPEALASLRAATQLAPGSARAHHLLGLLYKKLGDMKSAAASLVRAAALSNEDVSIQAALAEVMTARHAHVTPAPSLSESQSSDLGSFSGDLAILRLPEMLEFLMHQRATGVLLVTSEVGNGSIEFLQGHIARISSPAGESSSSSSSSSSEAIADESQDLLVTRSVPMLKELLDWRIGHVSFRALPELEVRESDQPLTIDPRLLLLETLRQIDEESR